MKGRSAVPRSLLLCLALCVSLLVAGQPPSAVAATPTLPAQEGTAPALLRRLREASGGQARISYHSQTGMVRFFGTPPDRPAPRPAGLHASSTPEDAARAFLTEYGALFGLTDAACELRVMRTQSADRGRAFVRFRQVYRDVPVLGGELVVQLDQERNVVSVNGEVLPALQVNVSPQVAPEVARETALETVAKLERVARDALDASNPELWLYNPILLGAPGIPQTRLVWRSEVRSTQALPVRELMLVDAQTGAAALYFNQIDTSRYREVYDNQNNPDVGLPGSGPVRVEGQPPTGVLDADLAYDYAGSTYDFYCSVHGRDGIDNRGMRLISTVRYCDEESDRPYENAFWNGVQAVFGAGFAAADDVVAHELTHGVTDHESNLFYYMQSGAINEAFSDIWGEFIDLTNGAGNDTPAVHWLHGEDLPGGANRSLSDPPAFGHPDRMTSPYYYCGARDGGGVHINSGVANKAAFLMTDGGAFNGKTVVGLGIPKVAKIWYEVQTHLFTSASDYQDLYDCLQQACADLVGTAGITAADCRQVKNALDAVEMGQQPELCAVGEALVCTTGRSPVSLFFDDLESGSDNWTSNAAIGDDLWYRAHEYATSGRYSLWGDDPSTRNDHAVTMLNDISLPAGSNAYLHFRHAYDLEAGDASLYDGAVVEYSTDGGSTWRDAGAFFTENGYNGSVSGAYDNSLAGRRAFGGQSYGYVSSRLDLGSLAGRHVRFRFRVGSDTSVGGRGWYIDDVRIYTCSSGMPSNRAVINELDLGTPDWVEFYNPEDHAVSMIGWRLLAYRAEGTLAATYVFPTFTLSSGAYVVLREGSGTNTASELYVGSSDIPWATASGGAAALSDSAGIGIDFARWGESFVTPPWGTGWSGSNPSSPLVGSTLGRDASSIDTDRGSDWTSQLPTPGGRNSTALPICYELATSFSPCAGGYVQASPAPNCAGGLYVAATQVTLAAYPAAGYAFSYWAGSVSDTNSSITLVMDGHKAVTAHFVAVPARTYLVYMPIVLLDHYVPGPTPMPTPTATPRQPGQWIVNPSFETDEGWEIPHTDYPAGYSISRAHSGARSIRLGIASGANVYSYSSVQQAVEIPADATRADLSFYYFPVNSVADNDRIYFCILRASDDFELGCEVWMEYHQDWHVHSASLLPYAGQRIKVHVGVKNDGVAGITAVYLDDVELQVQ